MVQFGSTCLILSSSLGSLGLEVGGSLLMSGIFSCLSELGSLVGEWVESQHQGLVLERVLLGLIVRADGVLDVSEFGLNLIRVYDPGEIGAGHDWTGESVSLLLVRWGRIGSEDRVELIESILGEDSESTEVTTWGQLEDVKSVDIASLNSWQVSSGLLHILGGIGMDDKWSLSHDVSGISVFSDTGSDFLGSLDLQEFVRDTEGVQSGEERTGG